MVKDAKIRVSLDTKSAEADLRDLGKQGEETAARINQQAKGGGGNTGAGGTFKKGAIAGVGFGLGRRIAGATGFMGSINEVISETFSGQAADFDKWVGAAKARATKGARDETAQNTALLAYHTGDTTASKAYYDQVLQVKHMPQQIGAANIQKALGGGRGESPDGMGPIDKILENITGAIKDGFNGITKLIGG